MATAMLLNLHPGVGLREEYFGVLGWRRGVQSFVTLKGLHAEVLLAARANMAVRADSDTLSALAELVDRELVVAEPWDGPSAELARIAPQLWANRPDGVAGPLWAHLQPFTSCNQQCLHCYCFGGPTGDRMALDEDMWLWVIQKLANYGIRDIYITGGETLLYPAVFQMADYILSLGLTCGLSTNAMAVNKTTMERLRALRLSSIQVSIDGATPGTNDRLRGAPGAFERTRRGLQQLAEITRPVVNTVVCPENLDELEGIVQLAVEAGCEEIKFFPEKIVGRSSTNDRHGLDDDQRARLAVTCGQLRSTYGVDIESLDNTGGCGSADTGFAIDQNGGVYPCIFGVSDPSQCAGNILHTQLDDLWFSSPVFQRFRTQDSSPCHRCEAPVSCS